MVSTDDDIGLCPNRNSSRDSSEEITSSEHTASTSCSQSLVEASGERFGGEEDHKTEGARSEATSDVDECLVISQTSVCAVDEGIASNCESLTSVSESSGECPSVEGGDEEITKTELSAIQNAVQEGPDPQDRACRAIL